MLPPPTWALCHQHFGVALPAPAPKRPMMASIQPRCPRPSGLSPAEDVSTQVPPPQSPGTLTLLSPGSGTSSWDKYMGVAHPYQRPLGDSGHPGPGKGTWPGLKQKAPVSQGTERQEGPPSRAGRDRQGLGARPSLHHATLGFEKDQNREQSKYLLK